MTGPDTSLAAPGLALREPVLVTGGAGFIGSNLADRLATEGHDILIYDALSRPGVERNLEWLKRRHPSRISVAIADVRDAGSLSAAAGQRLREPDVSAPLPSAYRRPPRGLACPRRRRWCPRCS